MKYTAQWVTQLIRYSQKKVVLILVLLCAVSYANTLGHGFVYDDAFFSNRPELHSLSSLPRVFLQSYLPDNPTAGAYRPFVIASFVVSYSVFGNSSLSFHITNILLHILATVLVFSVGKALGLRKSSAFIAALVFSVHPIHVEAVANIKSRDEILYAIFLMISILALLREKLGIKSQLLMMSISSISFFFALLSKEMAVVIFPILLVLAIWKRYPHKQLFIFLVFLSVPFGIYWLLRFLALGSFVMAPYTIPYVGNLLYVASFSTRFLTGMYIYGIYLVKLVFPLHLQATYAYKDVIPIENMFSWAWVLGGIAFFSGLVIMVYSLYKRQKMVFILLSLWYLVYFPISQILTAKGDIIAERWMYTPSVPFLLLIAYLLSKYSKKKYLVAIIVVVTSLFFVRTILRNQVWYSNLTLFESMNRDAPLSVTGQTLVATEYLKKGRLAESYTHAIIAEKIYPNHAELQNILGNIDMFERKYDDAYQHYQRSLQLLPGLPLTYSYLGALFYAKKDYRMAKQYFELLIEKQGYLKFEDILSYSAILTKLKMYNESLRFLLSLSEEDKAKSQTQFLLAVNYYKLGDQENLKKYIRWNPLLSREEREKIIISF